MFDTKPTPQKCILVAVNSDLEQAIDYLKELQLLAVTYGANVVKIFIQPLKFPDTKTYIGKGKCEEVENFIDENQIDLCIFDDDLTPSQTKNIEKSLKCKIFDRSLLILEIFNQNAKTSQAKIQVQLARLQYMLPRLTRLWTHLERQRGGIGSKSGAGEKEIETDKRRIRNKISLLKKELEQIEKNSLTQRKNRSSQVRVTLVGYTNAGKSSIMNQISKAGVLAQDKLFATLDTTVRNVKWNNSEFLLADTVGFIRKLPHHLIESFKSTLSEVKESDLLLHVVDVSNPNWEEHIKTVQKTIESLESQHKPMIMVFNKIDLINKEKIQDIEHIWNSNSEKKCIFVSSQKNQGIAELKDLIADFVYNFH